MKSIWRISYGTTALTGRGTPGLAPDVAYACSICWSFACCCLNASGFIVNENINVPERSIGSNSPLMSLEAGGFQLVLPFIFTL